MMPPRKGKRWQIVRRLALDRDGWRCVLCSKAGRLEVDHIRRLRDGGEMWDLHNLQTLCRKCHFSKTSAESGQIPRRGDHRAKADALVAELLESAY